MRKERQLWNSGLRLLLDSGNKSRNDKLSLGKVLATSISLSPRDLFPGVQQWHFHSHNARLTEMPFMDSDLGCGAWPVAP